MAIDLNRSPYFDDYDPDKKFHRILYRPTYAVQARELTQQQTILQDQIARHGDHIFKNGSMVIPGHVVFDSGIHFIKINSTFDGSSVQQDLFEGYKIQGVTSGVIAEVILSADIVGLDPKTLFVKYTDSGPNNYANFLDGETIQRIDDPGIQCSVQGNTVPEAFTSTGVSCSTSIEAGIYYINGFFAIVDAQTLIVDKYSNTPSTRVGLRLNELLITPEDDSSLSDNAQGSENFAAPGAHRLKLVLLLETIALTGDLTDDFIELQRIEQGTVVNEIRTTEYNELEKNLARRTFDESGNYTVRPFNVDIKEHLLDPAVTRLADGKYLASNSGFESKLAIGIEPGKAYVRGFERVKLATTWVATNKARTTGTNNNSVTNFNIGQFVYITQAFGVPDFSIYDAVDLYDTESTDGNTSGSIIGTAKVRSIELVDKNGTASLSVYKLFLFDISVDAGKAWSEVLWISSSDASIQFTGKTTVGGDFADYDLQIIEPTKKASIFKLPHQFIETLNSGGSDTTYTVQRTYPNWGVSDNKITIDAGSDSVFSAFTGLNYILMDIDASTADNAFIPITSNDVVLSSGGSIVTITLTPGYTNVRVVIPVVKQVSLQRTKSIQENRVFNIASPNTIPGNVDLLDRADGFQLVSVIEEPLGVAIDITDRYTFDGGQRDSLYDLARIKLNGNATAPTADIDIIYDHFSHSSGDYCSVDSYSTLDYNDIPVYYSEEAQYELTDCVDFRPVINAAGDGFPGTGGAYGEIPLALSNVRCDYEHYLSRIDKLYMDYTGAFSIIEGTPAIVPEAPKSPDDGMVLYEIFMNAYTYSTNDAQIKVIENKRYTMRDIGSLEKRIGNLEYYTALSLLEKDTAQYQIKDDAGLDRFKNGFIVEPFNSHEIGESISNDYKCAIDPESEIMRPTFESNSIDLEWDEASSSNVQKTGPIISLPYEDVSFISQSLASTTENVNPFAVRLFKGNMSFQPDSDNWYDTEKNGDLIVNDDAHYAALEYIASNAKGLNGIQWNSWQTLWSSSSTSGSSSTQIDRSRPHDTGQVRSVSSSVTTTTTAQKRTGTKTTPTSTTVNKNIGDRTVGINYIPFMRSKPILIKVDSMKPNTLVYPFFDDISVVDYCAPAIKLDVTGKSGSFLFTVGNEEEVTSTSGGTGIVVYNNDNEVFIVNWDEIGFVDGDVITGTDSGTTATLTADAVVTADGDQLVTDDLGRIALVFTIPSTDTLKFRTGERIFILSDQVNNTESNQTSAKGAFKSEGSLLQQEGTVLSTRTIRFNQEPVSQNRTVSSTSSSSSDGGWYDPLAQTFLVEEEGGCFVTKCSLFFQQKDSTLPVNFQIREVVNGYPGQVIVPYSETTLYPADISTSQDGSVETVFTMQAPVFLQQGAEYCFVVLSDSFEYNLWVGEMGQLDIVTQELISKQPYNGVLFKSQNASTWTANQSQDLKFILHKAKFQIETSEGSGIPLIGSTILNNKDLGDIYLGLNPIETFNASATVRVHQKGHGFTNDSFVTISGFSGTFNGIPGTEFNASHIISSVEIDSYAITVTTPATGDGVTGGDLGIASRNAQMDIIRPNISELIVPGTNSLWDVKSTTSQSVNGTQNDYVKSTTFSGINASENNFFLEAMMVASEQNETSFLSGEKSLEMRNTIFSDNRNLSPIVDVNRSACIAIGNRIDSPTTVSGTYTLTVSVGSAIVSVAHVAHEMATGSIINVTSANPIGDITALELSGDFSITRIDNDTYSYETIPVATPSADSDDVDVIYSDSHYNYVPENINEGGSVAAKYFTRKITIEEPSVAAKLLLTAVLMDKSDFEIWYKSQGPYDTTLFSDLPWNLLPTPDSFVPLSENISDFRDYEFTYEFPEEEYFTSIAIKLVSKSVDSTRVPIFDNLRVICLGT